MRGTELRRDEEDFISNKQLHYLNSSLNSRMIISRRIRYEDRRGAHRVLVGKHEGKGHLQDVDV
jgi:hypothetical protein